MINKNHYESPKILLKILDEQDVVTTSGPFYGAETDKFSLPFWDDENLF